MTTPTTLTVTLLPVEEVKVGDLLLAYNRVGEVTHLADLPTNPVVARDCVLTWQDGGARDCVLTWQDGSGRTLHSLVPDTLAPVVVKGAVR